jgi:hypothetical protein
MYRDTIGQCSFEKHAGDGIMDPEHYDVGCAGCHVAVMGKLKGRMLSEIARQHKGWLVFGKKLYCSMECVIEHDPQGVAEFLKDLDKQRSQLASYHQRWQDAFAAASLVSAATDSEKTDAQTPA